MSRMGVKYQKWSCSSIYHVYIHHVDVRDKIRLPTSRLWSMGNPMVTLYRRSKVKVMSIMWVKYQKSPVSAIYIHHRDQIMLPTPRLWSMGNPMVA